MPGARADGEQVLLWYGLRHDSEVDAVVSLTLHQFRWTS